MKKALTLVLLVVLLFATGLAQEQSSKYGWLAKDSYSFGFGFSYPKYLNTNWGDYREGASGGYLYIQRNFSEHVGIRLDGFYHHLRGWYGPVSKDDVSHATIVGNDQIGANISMVYYFVPCEPISPYMTVGLGGFWRKLTNAPAVQDNTSDFDYQFTVGIGLEAKIGQNWKLQPEFSVSTVGNRHFDGDYTNIPGGVLGGQQKAYAMLSLGLSYYFGYGEKSHLCDLYEGLGQVDYGKIEEIVKKYQTEPTTIDYARIEDIVKKYKPSDVSAQNQVPENWVLVGVNFDEGSAKLKSESMPILYNAAQILLTNPNVKVEIQGHTNNIGGEKFNQRLSLKRAEAVKNFLIAKGVAADRLTTVGYGKTKPIMDNKTAQGRELNRRIEFKVLSK